MLVDRAKRSAAVLFTEPKSAASDNSDGSGDGELWKTLENYYKKVVLTAMKVVMVKLHVRFEENVLMTLRVEIFLN